MVFLYRLKSYLFKTILMCIVTGGFSCSSVEKRIGVGQNDRLKNIFLKIDSVKIDIDTLSSNVNTIYSVINNGNNSVYCLYSRSKHSLEYYSLSKNNLLNRVILEKEGPQGVQQLDGIYAYTKDSIFLFSASYFYLIDIKGEVKNVWPINSRNTSHRIFFSDNVFAMPADNQNFFFNKGNQSLYVRNHEYRYSISQQTKEYYENATLLAQFSLTNAQPELTSIKYPDILQEKFGGHLTDPLFTFIPELNMMVYAFPLLSDIYTYDLKTEDLQSYSCIPKISHANSSFLPWNASGNMQVQIEHLNQNNLFGKLIYLSDEELFGRFHSSPKVQSSSRRENTVNERKLYFTLFDKNFNIILEQKFPYKNVGYLLAFYSNGLMYVPYMSEEEKMSFYTIEVGSTDNESK